MLDTPLPPDVDVPDHPPPLPPRRRGRALAWTALGLVAGYLVLVRPWMLTWGATSAEVARTLPGDDLVPDAATVATRAIDLPAPPARVWPWLVQIGTGRAGWYSYDWLDNGGHPSAWQILPGFQGLKPGDGIPMSPDGSLAMPVVAVDRPHRLTLGGRLDERFAAGWTFVLEPLGPDRTRLLVRYRMKWSGPAGLLGQAVLEPGHFIMERKMLLNLRERLKRPAGFQADPPETPRSAAAANGGPRVPAR
jgi:hypothetical protein